MNEIASSEADESRPEIDPVTLNGPEGALAKRRVSFKEDRDPTAERSIELAPIAEEEGSPPTARDSFSSESDDFHAARLRTRSEVAPSVIERFAITRERKWSITITSLIAAIPGFLLGLTLGYPSNAILDLTGEATELPPEFYFNDRLTSIFASMATVGAVLGGPVGGWIADRWGRKCSMMFCGIPYLIGYLVLSYAHYTGDVLVFNALLMSGRALAGFGMGWASTVAPVYTGEMCSAKLRGIFGNMFAIFITSGILFNYALGALRDFRYYSISLVAVGIVALFEVLMFWLPETPRWLVSRGQVDEAEDVLLWLRGKKIGTKKEITAMKKSFTEKKSSVWRLFLKRSIITPVVYVLIIFAVQQSGGINAITPFVSILLKNAGVSNPRAASIYSVGIPGLIFLVVAIVLVDFIGRKFLLVVSATGQFLGLAMLGIHAFISRPSLCASSNSSVEMTDGAVCNPHFQYLAVFSTILFVSSFTVGYNSVPYVLLAELLPLSVRGKASGMASSMAWGCASLFLFFYFDVTALITPWFTFWAIAIVNILFAIFVIVLVPETKGKQVTELENLFAKKPDVLRTTL